MLRHVRLEGTCKGAGCPGAVQKDDDVAKPQKVPGVEGEGGVYVWDWSIDYWSIYKPIQSINQSISQLATRMIG
jgi:hypothetical protein